MSNGMTILALLYCCLMAYRYGWRGVLPASKREALCVAVILASWFALDYAKAPWPYYVATSLCCFILIPYPITKRKPIR